MVVTNGYTGLIAEKLTEAHYQQWRDRQFSDLEISLLISEGLRSVTPEETGDLGYIDKCRKPYIDCPAWVFSTKNGFIQLRPDDTERFSKYLNPTGYKATIDIPEGANWITEGIVDAFYIRFRTKENCGITAGVSHYKAAPRNSGLNWLFDADGWSNPQVFANLVKAAIHTGGKVQLLPKVTEKGKDGAEEYFKSGKTENDFQALLDSAYIPQELCFELPKHWDDLSAIKKLECARKLVALAVQILDESHQSVLWSELGKVTQTGKRNIQNIANQVKQRIKDSEAALKSKELKKHEPKWQEFQTEDVWLNGWNICCIASAARKKNSLIEMLKGEEGDYFAVGSRQPQSPDPLIRSYTIMEFLLEVLNHWSSVDIFTRVMVSKYVIFAGVCGLDESEQVILWEHLRKATQRNELSIQALVKSAQRYFSRDQELPYPDRKQDDKGRPSNPQESEAAAMIGEDLRGILAYDSTSMRWLSYSTSIEGVWDYVTDDDVLGIIQSQIQDGTNYDYRFGQGFSAGFVRGVRILIKHELSLKKWLRLKDWRSPEGIIPFKNGTFNTETNTFEAGHKPENLLTWQLPRDYVAIQGEFDTIKQWLEFSFGGCADTIHRFHCLAAATLRNLYKEQIFGHFQGEPGSGKSTAIRFIQDLIGSSNSVSTSLSDMNNLQFETSSYVGKSLIAMPDQDDYNGRLGTFLRITGADQIRVEAKHKDPVEYLCKTMVLISSNGTVFKSRTGNELFRRQVLFTFDRAVPKADQDVDFNAKLQAELTPYTNFLLSIPRDEIHRTLHGIGKKINISPEQWQIKIENDSVAGWIEENLVFVSFSEIVVGGKDDPSTFYGNYYDWCQQSGRTPVTRQNLSRLFLQIMKQSAPDISVDKLKKKQGIVIRGVALKSANDNEPSLGELIFAKGEHPGEPDEHPVNTLVNTSSPHEITMVNPVNPISEYCIREKKNNNDVSQSKGEEKINSSPIYTKDADRGSPGSPSRNINGFEYSPNGSPGCSPVLTQVFTPPKKGDRIETNIGNFDEWVSLTVIDIDNGLATCNDHSCLCLDEKTYGTRWRYQST